MSFNEKKAPVNNEANDSNNGEQQNAPKVSKIKSWCKNHPKVTKVAKVVGSVILGVGTAGAAFLAGRASATSNDQCDDGCSDESYEEPYPGEEGDE